MIKQWIAGGLLALLAWGAQASTVFNFGGFVVSGDTFTYTFHVDQAGTISGGITGVTLDPYSAFQWLTLDGSDRDYSIPYAGAKLFSFNDVALTAGDHTITALFAPNPVFAPGTAPSYTAGLGLVNGSLVFAPAPVPEPASALLMMAGLLAVGGLARRRPR